METLIVIVVVLVVLVVAMFLMRLLGAWMLRINELIKLGKQILAELKEIKSLNTLDNQ